jgi:hypothetical protein
MATSYSNLPTNNSGGESTIRSFNNYYSAPIELNATAYAAMTGYFTNSGFDQSAAESISSIIMAQAKRDGYNPMQILDTLKGLDSVELKGLLAEILNYNRYKTSNLGTAQKFEPNPEILRNILV